MSEHCIDGGTMHNVQAVGQYCSDGVTEVSVISQLWGWNDVMDGHVVKFGHPVRRCVWCGHVFGYPLDPRTYPKTDDGDPAELELCRAEQGDVPNIFDEIPSGLYDEENNGSKKAKGVRDARTRAGKSRRARSRSDGRAVPRPQARREARGTPGR